MTRRPSRHSGRIACLLVALGAIVLSGLAPAAAMASSPATDDPAALRPTVHYEDAVAHEHDQIAFAPGGRVRVPFEPRATDRWLVDGKTPRALPAGRLSGRLLRDPAPATGPSADSPTVDPADVIATEGISFHSLVEQRRYEPTAAVDPGALRREVFGFLPYWELTDSSTRLDWEKISTVAYFGVGADGKGNLVKKNTDGSTTVGWSGWTSSTMTNVIDAAHASHARVVLTVQSFAWSSSGLSRQKALLGSATARSNLAKQIATAVRDRGAEGVNLDFEPIASGYADEFTALVRKVRAVLNATAPGYQLTFDTTGWIGNYPIEDATAPGGADAIFIMGYDYRQSGSDTVGSIAPIGGPSYDVADTIRAYVDRVPASKLILGVPYYGRAWSAATDAFGATNISGTKYGASASVIYTTARDFGIQYGRRYDDTEGVVWTAYKRENCTDTYGCVTPWRQLYYDDPVTIKAKYDLVNHYDLRGAGIWALGYDGTRPELYQAIEDKFITDRIPPVIKTGSLSTSVFSPNGDGRTDSATVKLTATGLISWGYVVRRLDGPEPGIQLRAGSKTGKAPLYTWDGTANDEVVPDGTYQLTLWAADASDNRAERSFSVVVDTTVAHVGSTSGSGFLSPDGDGHNDVLPISWSSNEAITGVVRIFDAGRHTIRSWTITADRTWATAWNGRTAAGKIVPDGRYTFRVYGLDRAGNLTVADRAVSVDRTIRSVRWSDRAFDPRAKQSSRAELVLRRPAVVAMGIYRGDTLVRTIWGGRSVTAGTYRWTWDGRTGEGALVAPGTYRIVVTATSAYGLTRYSTNVTVLVH